MTAAKTDPPPARPAQKPRRSATGPEVEAKPKLRLWIVYGDRIKFGHGRAELLQLVDAQGSISAAAAEFGMSYRNLWGYFRDLEKATGIDLLVRQRGSGPKAGTHLSPEGKAFLARYRKLRSAVESAVEREFARVYKNTNAP
jgi:molybdate transport system regulatory protein